MAPVQPMGYILFIDASAGRGLSDIPDVRGIQFDPDWHNGPAITPVLTVELDSIESPSFDNVRHDDYATPDVLY